MEMAKTDSSAPKITGTRSGSINMTKRVTISLITLLVYLSGVLYDLFGSFVSPDTRNAAQKQPAVTAKPASVLMKAKHSTLAANSARWQPRYALEFFFTHLS